MGGKTLYLRVGVLVLVGIALAVGFVLFLAGGRGGPVTVVETYTQDSVQGLDVGAPVRYRGVPIGRVTQIGLVGIEYTRAAQASPNLRELTEFQQVIIRFGLESRMLETAPPLEQMVADGLRARITAQGLTGVNYVELDFVPPGNRPPTPTPPWTPANPVIPSVPSTVSQVRTAAETLATQLADLPIGQIVTDIAVTLNNLSRQTSEGGDLASTLGETARAASVVRRALEGGELEQAVAELRRAAEATRVLLAGPELRGAVTNAAGAAAELRRSVARLPAAVDGIERTMRTARETTLDVQSELIPILQDLRATSAALRATVEGIRASPGQAIFGAPPTPDRRR
jgi:paraquat-inducible protein B